MYAHMTERRYMQNGVSDYMTRETIEEVRDISRGQSSMLSI